MAWYDFLNPVFLPLLKLGVFWTIFILSLVLSLLIVIIYKKFTDQDLMKQLKEEIKEFQKEMKTLKDNPQKMMQVQKRSMETNMKYMMHSFRPTLVTFIPLIIIFGWLNAHLAYDPIIAGNDFSVLLEFEEGTHGLVSVVAPEGIAVLNDINQTILENNARFVFNSTPGDYTLYFNYDNKEYSHEVRIVESKDVREYKYPIHRIRDSKLKEIKTNNEKTRPMGKLSIFGWRPGWIGTYIIFSLIFSIGLRKLLKVY